MSDFIFSTYRLRQMDFSSEKKEQIWEKNHCIFSQMLMSLMVVVVVVVLVLLDNQCLILILLLTSDFFYFYFVFTD